MLCESDTTMKIFLRKNTRLDEITASSSSETPKPCNAVDLAMVGDSGPLPLSIVYSNVDVLLGWRNDLVLALSFEARQLFDGSVDDFQCGSNLVLSNHQRRC